MNDSTQKDAPSYQLPSALHNSEGSADDAFCGLGHTSVAGELGYAS